MPIDKKYWSETEGLMAFAIENGLPVVPRIYEFEGRQYPVWEQTVNYRQKNVWLISTTDLRNKPNQTPSLPDLRAQNGGYYIFGFIYNIRQQGQGRSRVELQRYLAQRTNRQDEWTVLDWNGNPVQPISPSSAQNKPATKQAVAKSSPRKSAALVKSAVRNEKKDEKPDLETSRKIIQENFKKFQETYKAEKGIEFRDSDDVTTFYRNKADIAEVQKWNEEARTVDALIDPCAFNEAFLGNIVDPDLLILGKNPGAKDIDKELTEEALKKRIDEIKARRTCAEQKRFYPLSSVDAIHDLPWFPNRLIFGVGSDKWKKRDGHDGILYPFMQNGKLSSLCQYAERIASVELVPYHTINFRDNTRLQNEFGVVEEVKPIVKKAIERGAVILCPYYGAVDMWLDAVEKLRGYPFFYATHVKLGQKDAPQNGNLNINHLRHYSMIELPRTEDETCEPLFDQLVKLGWTRIKQ